MSKRKTTRDEVMGGVDCKEDHDKSLRCHWLIVKDDGTAIIGHPYRTKEDAKASIEFYNLSGVHLEHRINGVQRGDVQ